jgi:ABC-2 type transport system permease protein
MRRLVSTELLKLRVTRSIWGFVAVALVLAGLRTAMVFASIGTAAGIHRGTTEATMTIAGAAGTGVLVVLVLAVLSVTGEARHGTLTGSLLLVPHRRSLVVAKCLALSLVGVVSALVLLALGLAVALLSGIGGPLRTTDLLVLVAAVVTVGTFWAWVGVGVGLLVNNQILAVLIPVLWLLVVEPLVGASSLAPLRLWLPGNLPGQVLPSASGGPTPLVAVALLCVYGLALSLAGGARLMRRDVS